MHETVSKLRCLPLLETIVICVWNYEPRLYTFERLPSPLIAPTKTRPLQNVCLEKHVKVKIDFMFLRATYTITYTYTKMDELL